MMRCPIMYPEVEQAIVTLPKRRGRGGRGRGVLVAGGLVLTAAHCIKFDTKGGMVLGEWPPEEIETAAGRRLKVTPLAVEPVCDIAALGAIDYQEFSDEAKAFEEFCEETKPVAVSQVPIAPSVEFPVYVWALERRWVRAVAVHPEDEPNEPAPTLSVTAPEQIRHGASGGPIINESGEITF